MLSVAIFVCLGWILSVCLHEFGHAIVAYWGGDTSVKNKGYLTLNPLKYIHIDMSLMLPLLFLLIGGIGLPGAAVSINHHRLRSRWWQSAVSVAGPITDLIFTLLLVVVFHLSSLWQNTEYEWICSALAFLIYLEIIVIFINCLPIPSFDGFGAIYPWLPTNLQSKFSKISNPWLGTIALFFLLPLLNSSGISLWQFAQSITQVLGVPPQSIGTGAVLFRQVSTILLLIVIALIFIIRKLMQKPHKNWYEKGNTLSTSRKYEQAIAAYDRALQIQPNYYEAWLKRGDAQIEMEQYETALASYERAIEIQSEADEGWHRKGRVLSLMEQYEAALDSYERAIAIQPEDYLIWHSRGIALYEMNRFAEALESFDRALILQPHYQAAWSALYAKGSALYHLQRYEEALASFDRSVRYKSDCYTSWFERGVTLAQLDRDLEAINSFQKGVIRSSFKLSCAK